jgi:hypothetical protein
MGWPFAAADFLLRAPGYIAVLVSSTVSFYFLRLAVLSI